MLEFTLNITMTTTFYIKKERLEELQSLIRELPSVRWEHNPLPCGKDQYNIKLSMTVEDYNKLSQLQNKWWEEDNPPKQAKSLWNKIISYFS